MTKRILTHKEALSKFHYNYLTGDFWVIKTGKKSRVCKLAGSIDKDGYLVTSHKGVNYRLHRLAWFYVYGVWPKDSIDHINRCKTDNRISNLRECSNAENQRNVDKRVYNTSGYKGVSFVKRDNKWGARARLDGKVILLGQYKTPELASQAYQEFAKKHHGEFYFEHNA